jgi:hypothetical protein
VRDRFPLVLRFKKKADAPVTLTAVRPDGTVATARIGAAAGFGPVHDLTHYVVERRLGYRDAFLGLLAAGWRVEDFERDAAARLPDEAIWAEVMAGELSREAAMGQWLGQDEFNWAVGQALARAARGRRVPPAAPLPQQALDAMREEITALWAEWLALPTGETLELSFDPIPTRTRGDR